MADRAGVCGPANNKPGANDWLSVRIWRRTKRQELVARRQALRGRDRQRANDKILASLDDEGPPLAGERIGFYWPIKGEVDLRPLIRELLQSGAEAALPVVVARNSPVEFWRWTPQQKLCSRGLWNIPAPADRNLVVPTVILAPLVGFDSQCYRLGNGGGYYDRTLAAMHPKPLIIGIGYEFTRLRSILPQPHDIAMDRIVTESGQFARPAIQTTDRSG